MVITSTHVHNGNGRKKMEIIHINPSLVAETLVADELNYLKTDNAPGKICLEHEGWPKFSSEFLKNNFGQEIQPNGKRVKYKVPLAWKVHKSVRIYRDSFMSEFSRENGRVRDKKDGKFRENQRYETILNALNRVLQMTS